MGIINTESFFTLIDGDIERICRFARPYPIEIQRNCKVTTSQIRYKLPTSIDATRFRLQIWIRQVQSGQTWNFERGEITTASSEITLKAPVEIFAQVAEPTEIRFVVQCKPKLYGIESPTWETAPDGETKWMRLNIAPDEFATFDIQSASCTTPELQRVVGATVNIAVTVANVGTLTGSTPVTIQCTSPEELEATSNITINPFRSLTVTFSVTPTKPGTYQFTINTDNDVHTISFTAITEEPIIDIESITCITPEANRYVGNEITYRMVVSNTGSKSGLVRTSMECTNPEALSAATDIVIGPVTTKPVEFSFTPAHHTVYHLTFTAGDKTRTATCSVDPDPSPSPAPIFEFQQITCTTPKQDRVIGNDLVINVPVMNVGNETGTVTVELYSSTPELLGATTEITIEPAQTVDAVFTITARKHGTYKFTFSMGETTQTFSCYVSPDMTTIPQKTTDLDTIIMYGIGAAAILAVARIVRG